MLYTVANLHPHWTQEYTFIKAIPLLLFKSSPPTSQPHSQTAHAKHSSGRSSRCRSSLFQSANVDTIMLSSFRVISFERHIKQSGKSYHSVYWIRSEWCYITNSINYCSYKWTRNQTSPSLCAPLPSSSCRVGRSLVCVFILMSCVSTWSPVRVALVITIEFVSWIILLLLYHNTFLEMDGEAYIVISCIHLYNCPAWHSPKKLGNVPANDQWRRWEWEDKAE